MWMLLLGLLLAVVGIYFMPAEARRLLGWTVAAIVAWLALYVASDLVRSFRNLARSREASERIPLREVKVDDLQITGTTPATYEIRGLVHNLSPTQTLTVTRFTFIVQDCITADTCVEQARGHAEVMREVRPNQAAAFSTHNLMLMVGNGSAPLLPPRGERRIVSNVWLTMGK